MLRVGAYRLWKATAECASLEMGSLGQAALRCLPQLEAALVSSGHARSFSAAAGEEEERVITNPKVLELAEQITQLNLLEVSDLTELLRKRLNIQTPAGGMGFAFPPGGMAMAAAPAAGT
jgi:large subunit ribosomal protein L7/L12